MRPTRRSQPYRKGAREPSSALAAMLAGQPRFLPNPADFDRRRSKLAKAARRRFRG